MKIRWYIKENDQRMDTIMEDWITSLKTDTPQEGFELAITLARKGVAYKQPSVEIREQLIDASANNY